MYKNSNRCESHSLGADIGLRNRAINAATHIAVGKSF